MGARGVCRVIRTRNTRSAPSEYVRYPEVHHVHADVYNVGMVRKQLYLEESQDQALKHRAKELGISEAEVVRRALDQAFRRTPASPLARRRQELLAALFKDADRVVETSCLPDEYRFNRQELYEEDKRFTRWDKV